MKRNENLEENLQKTNEDPIYRWVAVDKGGTECLYKDKPVRSEERNSWLPSSISFILLPRGTVERMLGYKLTWENEPIKIDMNKL